MFVVTVLGMIQRWALGVVVSVVAVLWLLVFGLDLLTGPNVSFSIFYLAPIAVVALRFGRGPGWVAALLGALTWFGADRIGGRDGIGGLVPLWNGLVRLGLFVIVATLLVAVRELLDAQRREARIDALTGVLNPRGFREVAEIELERAVRTGRPVSLAYIDLDHFKRLNDARGHSTGDEALRRIGQTLRDCVRGHDLVGRVGGDEFVVLFPETDSIDVRSAIRRTRMRLRVTCVEFDIDASLGVVTFDAAPANLDTALRRADGLMYEAKGAARGSVRFESDSSRRNAAVSVESNPAGALPPEPAPPDQSR